MSHFYGMIPTSARKTVPTARGHADTGLTTAACSWAGRVEVELFTSPCPDNPKVIVDRFRVRMLPHHGNGDSAIICEGEVGNAKSVSTAPALML
jgi:hypothetical protein